MITVIGRHCNSVEIAQPGDRTTNPGIVMPECYASSQRVDSLAKVVITPVRHAHGYIYKNKSFYRDLHLYRYMYIITGQVERSIWKSAGVELSKEYEKESEYLYNGECC